MPNPADFSIFDTIQSPDGRTDIRKLLANARFNIYALKGGRDDFHLRTISPISFQRLEDGSYELTSVSISYIAVDYRVYDRVVVLHNALRDRGGPSALSSIIGNMQDFLPKGIHGLGRLGGLWKEPPWNRSREDFFRQEDSEIQKQLSVWLEDYVSDRGQSNAQLVWSPPETTGLPFVISYQDEAGPIAIAYSKEENGELTIVSVGVPRSKFEPVLTGLICLQEDEGFVEQFQKDLGLAYDVMDLLLEEEQRSRKRRRA